MTDKHAQAEKFVGSSGNAWPCGHMVLPNARHECPLCEIAEKDKEIVRLREALGSIPCPRNPPCGVCTICIAKAALANQPEKEQQ